MNPFSGFMRLASENTSLGAPALIVLNPGAVLPMPREICSYDRALRA